MTFVAVALALALVFLLIAWGLWPRQESPATGNAADQLIAQYESDWPTFVGKPSDKSH